MVDNNDFEKRKRKQPSFAGLRFGVRFFFGALLGLLLGFSLWARSMDGLEGWFIMPSLAGVMGLAAACWGDDFWFRLKDWLFWWP